MTDNIIKTLIYLDSHTYSLLKCNKKAIGSTPVPAYYQGNQRKNCIPIGNFMYD